MVQIPRNVTRRAYIAYASWLRSLETREDRGLAQHPANAMIDCPGECNGSGEVNVHWYAEDGYTCDRCPMCNGEGELQDGFIDPLVTLRSLRRFRFTPAARARYNDARRVALCPNSRLAQSEMNAWLTITRTSAIRLRETIREARQQVFGVAA